MEEEKAGIRCTNLCPSLRTSEYWNFHQALFIPTFTAECTIKEYVLIYSKSFYNAFNHYQALIRVNIRTVLYYLGQSALLDTPSRIVRTPSTRIVHQCTLSISAPLLTFEMFLGRYYQLKIIYQCYPYFKSRFSSSKIAKNFKKLIKSCAFFIKKQKNICD